MYILYFTVPSMTYKVCRLPSTSQLCYRLVADIFPKLLEIFSPNFTCLLYVPIYAGLQILFI